MRLTTLYQLPSNFFYLSHHVTREVFNRIDVEHKCRTMDSVLQQWVVNIVTMTWCDCFRGIKL